MQQNSPSRISHGKKAHQLLAQWNLLENAVLRNLTAIENLTRQKQSAETVEVKYQENLIWKIISCINGSIKNLSSLLPQAFSILKAFSVIRKDSIAKISSPKSIAVADILDKRYLEIEREYHSLASLIQELRSPNFNIAAMIDQRQKRIGYQKDLEILLSNQE